MKKKKLSQKERLELLNKQIQSLYEGKDLYQASHISYEDSIIDMFEVTQVLKYGFELTHLFDDRIFSPVVFDQSIAPLIKKRDVFMMHLGLKHSLWSVIYMSPPYTG